MKLFIGWSKPRSRQVAELLRRFLPLVVQSLEPWYSDDVASGQRWNPEIAAELGRTQYGILCVTPENQQEPWLLFEAGALANAPITRSSGVVPVLLGFDDPSQLLQPLAQFQARMTTEADMWRLVADVNRVCHETLDDERLRKTFDAHWPELGDGFAKVAAQADVEPSRSADDMAKEILNITRGQESREMSRAMGASGYFGVRPNDLTSEDRVVRDALWTAGAAPVATNIGGEHSFLIDSPLPRVLEALDVLRERGIRYRVIDGNGYRYTPEGVLGPGLSMEWRSAERFSQPRRP